MEVNHMRKFFAKVKDKVNQMVAAVKAKVADIKAAATEKARVKASQAVILIESARTENFVDSGIKILIAVVIGALLLAGLYALFGDTILPTLTDNVEEMFNFSGSFFLSFIACLFK